MAASSPMIIFPSMATGNRVKFVLAHISKDLI